MQSEQLLSLLLLFSENFSLEVIFGLPVAEVTSRFANLGDSRKLSACLNEVQVL